VNVISRGFTGRRQSGSDRLPPGQYLEGGFPVLQTGPTEIVDTAAWRFTITTEAGDMHSWTWKQFLDLPTEEVTTDIHCVTQWTKLDTTWRGVSCDVLLDGIDTSASFVMARSHGGYTTNMPLADLRDGKAWVAFEYDGAPLHPDHGGPARLLVPHLYLWKSAKWIRELELMPADRRGFWELGGYHDYGDPWREQRFQGD
jgi:DMSO/TMAO reductase YedYZ molybdopterin-dependent catalytic subunit